MKHTNDLIYMDGYGWQKASTLFTSIMFFVLLFLSAPAQNQFSGETGVVTGDQVRLRGGPGTNYKQVGLVNQGKQLKINRKQGEWFEVHPPSQARVWIYGQFVDKLDASTGKVIGTDVNVRPLPRADQTNSPVGQVSKPAKVIIRDTKQSSSDEHPWYQIQMPDGIYPWIHSRFLNVGASGQSGESGEQGQATSQGGESPQKGSPNGNGVPQKGGPVQKGGVQKGGGGTASNQQIGAQGAPEEWVERLEAIQDDVREERSKEDKLQWDFSDEINRLDEYIQNVPDDRLKGQASELRSRLQEVQSNVREQRARLNERLKEIKEERQELVRNSIEDVLKAKGFTWDAVGYVKSVGGLLAKPPGEYELVKGKERIYFLKSGRNILKLRNYLHLQVAISGNVQPVNSKSWDVPLMVVEKVEVIR